MFILSICGSHSSSQLGWRDFSASIGKVSVWKRVWVKRGSEGGLTDGRHIEDLKMERSLLFTVRFDRGLLYSAVTVALSGALKNPPEITPLNSTASALMQKGGYCVNILLEHLSILIFHKVIFGVEQLGVLMFREAPSCRKKEAVKETEKGGRGKRRSVYLLECWELEFTTGA